MIKELEKTLKIAENKLRDKYKKILIDRNKISEEQINKILKDLDKSNIFSFNVDDFLEEEDILLENNKNFDILFKERIKIKQNEIEQNENKNRNKNKNIYGRSPLHEAIVKKDIKNITFFLTNKMYLDKVDNNKHTPYEMAVFLGDKEVIELFEKIN